MFLQPASLNAAIDLLAQQGGKLLAGGTDFFPAMGQAAITQPVIDISRLPELRAIETAADTIRLGAAATWSEIVAAPLPPGFDALKASAREIGSVQIQNRGTIGGNLCNASPAADSVPPLLTLDARIELVSPRGPREMPIAQFIRGNRQTELAGDEIVTAVLVPKRNGDLTTLFSKLGARRYLVISIAMIAVALRRAADGGIADARIAVGSCSAVAMRLPDLEAALIGSKSTDDIAARINADHLVRLTPIDDIRATAHYRRDAALTLVRRAIQDCFAATPATMGQL
jgi:CO/xanthine dehydrogenase FAD-binding subunit